MGSFSLSIFTRVRIYIYTHVPYSAADVPNSDYPDDRDERGDRIRQSYNDARGADCLFFFFRKRRNFATSETPDYLVRRRSRSKRAKSDSITRVTVVQTRCRDVRRMCALFVFSYLKPVRPVARYYLYTTRAKYTRREVARRTGHDNGDFSRR